MAAWQRTHDATALWLRHRGPLAGLATPVIFTWYALSPLAAVRALSDARWGEYLPERQTRWSTEREAG
jgi:hypothetical protein